jgi:protein-disulfide isomerase
VVIVGLVAAILVVVVRAAGGDDTREMATGEVVAPSSLTPTGAIPVGEADAPVTVEIYFDYMCPACGRFEAANGAELDRLVEEGVARVELRPISFLDEQSGGTEYSTRAANALATVADLAPAQVWDLHGSLYRQQPAEGTEGLSDAQIADVAADAGVPAGVLARFTDGRFRPWVASATQQAFDSGVEGTPTVKIDGAVFDGDVYTPGPLTEAIHSAAGHP